MVSLFNELSILKKFLNILSTNKPTPISGMGNL